MLVEKQKSLTSLHGVWAKVIIKDKINESFKVSSCGCARPQCMPLVALLSGVVRITYFVRDDVVMKIKSKKKVLVHGVL